MASSTFMNLNQAKRRKIQQALVKEFSHHSLATAQVARIIKDAGIARGSFYKYFTDLVDAYQWSLGEVMEKLRLHPRVISDDSSKAIDYCTEIKKALLRIQDSPYLQFIQMFYVANEGLLIAHQQRQSSISKLSGPRWGIMVLCHEAIRECLLHPEEQERYLTRLQDVLQKITGE